MKFSYELNVKGQEVSLEIKAPSEEDLIETFHLSGKEKVVNYLQKKVNWNSPLQEVMDRIRSFSFCQIVSSEKTEDQKIRMPEMTFASSYEILDEIGEK